RRRPGGSSGTVGSPTRQRGEARRASEGPKSPRWRVGLPTSLEVAHVRDGGFQVILVPQLALARLLGPPAPAAGTGRLQVPGRPGLELLHHHVGVAVGGDDDVDVVGPGPDGVQHPAADLTVLAYGLLDDVALLAVQGDRRFGHDRAGRRLALRVSSEVHLV